jgi:hypothetical protein
MRTDRRGNAAGGLKWLAAFAVVAIVAAGG